MPLVMATKLGKRTTLIPRISNLLDWQGTAALEAREAWTTKPVWQGTLVSPPVDGALAN